MSDATQHPDADAWAKACAEDLEDERARRRGQAGPPPGAAAEELRKLVDAVAEKVAGLRAPLLGAGAQNAVQQLVSQAKSAVEPMIERNPEVFDHLAAAGSELLAAYRSAVEGQERRWTQGRPGAGKSDDGSGRDDRDNREGPDPSEHIDLD
ncbi:DUF5304 domain-containing protein [Streptomyces sp. NPDC093546]|uniref:DUF5304 domain-containing protein n=1 Tax=Streptomyces sp. NPDC093546 TaxID=3366040 RepID=UPI00380F65FB